MKKRLMLILLTLIVVGCGDGEEEKTADGKTKVTLFLSYIPSVQFAPIYVAYERGYFAEEGIEITFENSFDETDGVDRLARNNLQFGIISGEQVILARGAEKPLVYVMEWYHRFPVGIVVPEDSEIETPEDLAGKEVGLPGFFGASYIGLRALLTQAGLTENDLNLQAIGFAAPEQMCERRIEAATVYIVNEPLTIEKDCYAVRVIEISDYANLVSNGLVTNEETIREKADLVRGMVRAIQRGIVDTIADPEAAFELSIKHVPNLPDDQLETQKQVLINSVELWRSDNVGATTPEAWTLTQQILVEAGLMAEAVDNIEAAYSNEFLSEVTVSE